MHDDKTPNRVQPPLVQLREVRPTDLTIFFKQQQDPKAVKMAAFTAKDPADRVAFMAHWAKIQADISIPIRTIVFDGRVAGYILSHDWFGDPEVSYWIGNEFWGKGIATQALRLFLEQLETRPLYARVAKDNIGSRRVLDKCGFSAYAVDRGYANAREREIEEILLVLR